MYFALVVAVAVNPPVVLVLVLVLDLPLCAAKPNRPLELILYVITSSKAINRIYLLALDSLRVMG